MQQFPHDLITTIFFQALKENNSQFKFRKKINMQKKLSSTMKVKYIHFQTKNWIISEKQAAPKEKLKGIKSSPSDPKQKGIPDGNMEMLEEIKNNKC